MTEQAQLNTPPPSPWELRNEYEALVIGDLKGPTDGDDETINPRIAGGPRERYLVGMLAPDNTIALDPERIDRASIDGDDTPEDSSQDDAESATVRLFPNSLGLTFAVNGSIDTITASVRFGRYTRETVAPGEDTDDTSTRPARIWQRTQVDEDTPIALTDGDIGPISPIFDQPEVIVRGRAVRTNDHWVVSLYLVNNQTSPERDKDAAWLFQAELEVIGTPEHPAPFIGRDQVLDGHITVSDEDEVAALDMQYRDTVEFAAGHNVGVKATAAPNDPTHATRIITQSVPTYEVPTTDFPTVTEGGVYAGLADAVFDMKTLSTLDDAGVTSALQPLVDTYRAWVDQQAQRLSDPNERLDPHATPAHLAIEEARAAADRIQAGIDQLADTTEAGQQARDAFRFANHAMWQQRIHGIAAADRRTHADLTLADAIAGADIPKNRSWRPFQIVFLLLNLPALTDPLNSERGPGLDGVVDLLFFPTGGGKTEAYLGLAAYTMAIRRLQGVIDGYDGGGGVAVLMRYTLRLLTAQQFQRAAALVCAAETIRRTDTKWGENPFRLGMWVGAGVTPNRNADAARAITDARSAGRKRGSRTSPLQLVACPWCGSSLELGRDVREDTVLWRTFVDCPDDEYAFSQRNSYDDETGISEGIPVVTVDEELYRLLPAFIIATVDKFAQLPWQGQLQLLFGKATRRCTRHGYRSADLDDVPSRDERDSHNQHGNYPRATTVDIDPLRPPDLIIQDELHLISGPLGSLMGLYETAIDELATWTVEGRTVRPKVVASTATVRHARDQAYRLFYRDLQVFPPPVLDAGDTFFGLQRDPAPATPGRRYVGICAHGNRLKQAEVRVYLATLAAAKLLFDKYGQAADPYMTLVGYFSSLRELGGARRLVDDDIRRRLRDTDRRGLAKRFRLITRELTSRISSTDIPDVLDQLAIPHTPPTDDGDTSGEPPIDVLLATNMVSVGVDVPRLGLMAVTGQPKSTAEYIQSTSRVGRSATAPGLVFTIYNWARPRDLSHYERFVHYHATFYRNVEALSVTPFASRAIERGLTAVLVALARHDVDAWNPNRAAQTVPTDDDYFTVAGGLIDRLASRAQDVTSDPAVAAIVRSALHYRLDAWSNLQQGQATSLAYKAREGDSRPLLQLPEAGPWTQWTCPNSLRETEAPVNLIVTEHDGSMSSPARYQLSAGDPSAVPRVDTVEDDTSDDGGSE